MWRKFDKNKAIEYKEELVQSYLYKIFTININSQYIININLIYHVNNKTEKKVESLITSKIGDFIKAIQRSDAKEHELIADRHRRRQPENEGIVLQSRHKCNDLKEEKKPKMFGSNQRLYDSPR
jgi:hypothetical protein